MALVDLMAIFSLKASFEAINLGLQTHEFAIGRDLVGLSGSSDGLSSLPSTPTTQNQKRKKTQNRNQSTPLVAPPPPLLVNPVMLLITNGLSTLVKIALSYWRIIEQRKNILF